MQNLKMALTITAVLLLGFGAATMTSSCEALDSLTDGGGGGGDGGGGGGEDGGGGGGEDAGTCTPECAGAACGASDGCGAKCDGTCEEGKVCNASKQCVVEGCEPACAGKACGDDDGCEGKCDGTCPEGEECNTTTFECEGPEDPCETCVATNCPAEFDQCANKNVECALIYLCIGECTDDDCVTDCYMAHPNGQDDYDAVVGCAQTECPEDCGGGDPCAGKLCGDDDGAGGKCYDCADPEEYCDIDTWTCKPMACVPDCDAKVCGDDDGCGDFCRGCADANKACNPTTWLCEDLGACGDVTFAGCCAGSIVRYCEGGAVQEINCDENSDPAQKVCGWKDQTDIGSIYDCGGDGIDPTGVNPIDCP
ncbi:MAG: hypothetical protein HY897_00665 [Deltaproteobacteria bacterium]|nr:hypothetical protein [Deltaproteobacteria bacterium]